jgi:ketosteroid isomerase-like protein
MSEVMYCPTCGALWYSAMAHTLVQRGAPCETCGGPLAHRELGLERGAGSEVAEAYYDAWRKEDAAAARAVLHPEVEFHPAPEVDAGKAVFRGHDGALRLWALLAELWEGFTPVPRLVRELDRGHVLVVTEVDARSRTRSSARLTGPATCLWRVVDGKLRSDRMRVPAVSELETAGLWPRASRSGAAGPSSPG